MKSFAWWKHEVVACAVYTGMILLMITTGWFMPEHQFRMIENKIFGWLEKGHVN